MRLNKKNKLLCNRIGFVNSLRALNIIALFVFIMNSFLFSQILKNIESDFLKIDSEILSNHNKLDSLLLFIDKNEIDNIFIHVYSNGEAIYDSDLIFNSDSIKHEDKLSLLLTRIDTMDVKVHAWVDVYSLWQKNKYPDNVNHFYFGCKECLESDINGRSDGDINLDQIQSFEWEGIFLSPLHPIVNNYILSIIDEIIEKYNIDGIFLDYLRYQDYYYGYNIKGINEFENNYGINPQDINRGIISRRYGYNKNQIDSLKLVWDNFKSDKITELLKTIKNDIKYQNLIIGASAMSDPLESKNRWHQDWGLWLNEDIIDYIVINNSDLNFINFNYLIKKINNQINYNNKSNIYFEMSTSFGNVLEISNKIIALRLNGYENIGINYNFNNDTLNWYDSIYENINFKLY